MKQLDITVFPSEQKTIWVEEDPNYGGAHHYQIVNCLGFNDGKTEYGGGVQFLRFVHKDDQGNITPGLQSEQLIEVLIDRHKKLNARFRSKQNEKMIEGLEMFLVAAKERVEERMQAGVMGKLENIPAPAFGIPDPNPQTKAPRENSTNDEIPTSPTPPPTGTVAGSTGV